MAKSILIVEDDVEIRDSLSELLRAEGYQTTLAENGAKGLEALRTMNRPCLILLDVMMPVMDGKKFMEIALKNDLIMQIPVVITTAGRDIPPGGKHVLRKPYDLDQLLAIVKAHCGS